MITTPEQVRFETEAESLDKIRIPKNHVLIKIEKKNVNRKTKSGLTIVTDAYGEQVDHIDRIGIVAKLPERLYFNNKRKWKTSYGVPDRMGKLDPVTRKYPRRDVNVQSYVDEPNSMSWETEMEMKLGDIVIFCYLEAINAPIINIGNDRYLLVRYDECYAVKRPANHGSKYVIDGFEIIPINGNLICEEVKKEKEFTTELVYENQINTERLKVKFVGKPVIQYFDGRSDCLDEIKEGDILIKSDKQIHTKLEYLYHSEFFGEMKEYLFMQRRWFVAKAN